MERRYIAFIFIIWATRASISITLGCQNWFYGFQRLESDDKVRLCFPSQGFGFARSLCTLDLQVLMLLKDFFFYYFLTVRI